MRRMFVSLAIILVPASVFAQTHVNGHYRRDGTYVPPHLRTNPNDTRLDNWSTRGNVNPYTGRTGTVDPYRPSTSYGLGSTGYGSTYGTRRRGY